MSSVGTDSTSHPPRPANPFFIFKRDLRKALKERACDITNQQLFNVFAGAEWKRISAKDRVYYYQLAREEKREHSNKFPGYVFRPNRKGLGRNATKGTGSNVVVVLENNHIIPSPQPSAEVSGIDCITYLSSLACSILFCYITDVPISRTSQPKVTPDFHHPTPPPLIPSRRDSFLLPAFISPENDAVDMIALEPPDPPLDIPSAAFAIVRACGHDLELTRLIDEAYAHWRERDLRSAMILEALVNEAVTRSLKSIPSLMDAIDHTMEQRGSSALSRSLPPDPLQSQDALALDYPLQFPFLSPL
ncbi:hypothetical protein NLI96_g7050 [Meripilus lineatus]|uniref:HMG box domain-containing protein n=1 Tax=Meripilus lineatus TaxID=2056292 RepID=A0AAD5V1N4_9APHY|nr:hypothetical protein NLI96_g7050 [Physisporinus lineatus]